MTSLPEQTLLALGVLDAGRLEWLQQHAAGLKAAAAQGVNVMAAQTAGPEPPHDEGQMRAAQAALGLLLEHTQAGLRLLERDRSRKGDASWTR